VLTHELQHQQARVIRMQMQVFYLKDLFLSLLERNMISTLLMILVMVSPLVLEELIQIYVSIKMEAKLIPFL
jgi:hypothetical protein